MSFAVADLGTNSARLMIAHIRGGDVVSDFKTLRTIRIGEGMNEGKGITQGAMERTKETLSEFKAISGKYNADKFYCFATSAVREAANRAKFIDYIRDNCGVEIEIISGEKEALLGFAGCVKGRGGMFDIGGGSTEVMLGALNDIKFMHSFKIGTVRMLQMFPEGDRADTEAFRKAHELAGRTFGAIPDAGDAVFIGIGGSATALAAIDLELKEYSSDRIQGHVITLERARQLCEMLESKTKEQRKQLIGLEENRADVIVFGAIILLEFMKAADAERITVSDRDNQEGYLAMKLGLA